jgi:secondary thiamine-phosphate synthase enzyme
MLKLSMNNQFTVSTNKRIELVDITDQIEEIVRQADISQGSCLIFVPHSTAAILITENETGLIKDWEKFIKKLTAGETWKHNRIDNNAEAHLLSGLIGQTKTIPIKNNQLQRGTWQQIFLVELDGPRGTRKITVQCK